MPCNYKTPFRTGHLIFTSLFVCSLMVLFQIHRIRYGSIAYQNGQLKKGDKVIAINNQPTAGLTHSAATKLLKVASKFI